MSKPVDAPQPPEVTGRASSAGDATAALIHHPRPAFALDTARALLHQHFGLAGALTPLDSERDQNFRVASAGAEFVLKIVNAAEPATAMPFQTALLRHVERVEPSLPLPRVVPLVDGRDVGVVEGPTGERHALRLVTFLPGTPLARAQRTPDTLRDLGQTLGRLDWALASFGHPGAFREFDWHIRNALASRQRLPAVADPARRAVVGSLLDGLAERVAPAFDRLRHGVIHNDANDWNVLVDTQTGAVSGLIDVGDAVFAPVAAELAVACAYALLGQPDPLLAAAHVVAGYHRAMPLQAAEVEALFDLVAARLCISVTISATRQSTSTDPYLFVSEAQAWTLLQWLADTGPDTFTARMHRACWPALPTAVGDDALLDARRRHLGGNLSLSYQTPLHFVRGDDVWLVDLQGRRFLDCYNNVAHVGHCHPRVVAAVATQASRLNTNTRYLHENIVTYAERLALYAAAGARPLLLLQLGERSQRPGSANGANGDPAPRRGRPRLGLSRPHAGAHRGEPVQVQTQGRGREAAVRARTAVARVLPRARRLAGRRDGGALRGRSQAGARRGGRRRRAPGRLHRRDHSERRRPGVPARGLSRRGLRRDPGGGRAVYRRRSPSRLRSYRHPHVGVRGARRRAGHRHDG